MESLTQLLESWSAEILSRSSRVRMLIGDRHWLSDGSHREALLRDFVRSRIPAVAEVCHGFLVEFSNGLNSSPEIDLFVRDTSTDVPYFCEGGLTICDPRSALALLEVKASFRSDALGSALQNIASTQRVVSRLSEPNKVWRGVCFTRVEAELEADSIVETIQKQLGAAIELHAESDSHGWLDYAPSCLIGLDNFCAFLTPSGTNVCKLKFFSAGQLSFAVGVADMLSHVYSHYSARAMQPLDKWIQQSLTADPIVVEIPYK